MPLYLSRSEARSAAEACGRIARFTRKDMERLGDGYVPAAESMRKAAESWELLEKKFLAHANSRPPKVAKKTGRENVVPLRPRR
jgi:hypothetical protein